MAPSTRPALAHDTACSALRPPNTTATLILRCSLIRSPPLLSQPPDGSACPASSRLPRRFVPGCGGAGPVMVALLATQADQDYSHPVIVDRDLWRKSWDKLGQNCAKNAGL